jgi:hypothetical protein
MALLIALMAACGESTTTEEEAPTEEVEIEVPQYEIVEAGDLNFAKAVRLEYYVVPELDVTEEEIKLIADDIVDSAKESEKFNAIVIWFIDDARQIGNGYTIAKVEYAPEGDWSKAADVKSGDYDTHEYVYDIGSSMSGKLPRDFEEGVYPTEEEKEVYFYWSDLVYEQGIGGDDAVQQTADNFDLSFEDADETIRKVNMR